MTQLDYIHKLGESKIRLGLDRIQTVLASLENPQNQYPAIHLAGTNGKGSVGAMCDSVLRKSYAKVGLYTSPHLISLHERYQINGKSIRKSELEHLTSFLRQYLSSKHLKKIPLTQFEFLTVLGFLWFAKEKVDIAIIETGMGGRLDATNTMGRVWASVITNIEFDHVKWLGKTKRKIAFEKAGIIKPYVPVITGAKGEAFDVIRDVANQKKAPLIVARKPVSYSLSLKGDHQKKNAAIAEATLKVIGQVDKPIPHATIKKGIQRATWPGRFERFGNIILDGGHNPSAVAAFVKTLRKKGVDQFDLLFGVLQDKDYQKMSQTLSPCVKGGRVVPLPSDRNAPQQKIAQLKPWRNKMLPLNSIQDGWHWLKKTSRSSPVVVTGSLYLVGDIRRRILSRNRGQGPQIDL